MILKGEKTHRAPAVEQANKVEPLFTSTPRGRSALVRLLAPADEVIE
jgi:hypothetical protein